MSIHTIANHHQSLLESITSPCDLRGLTAGELTELAEQIRGFLINQVTRTGGHLGPNLGVVELTIALHRVFDSPRDIILFDTGHQTYVHKILTGRQDEFTGLRRAGGLSGYPSRAESVHDSIENSHASTALSYADGLTKAFALRGSSADRRVVAVVGDGALTGGMCWEALNNIGGAPDRPMIIVLNDNGRSYDPTVGAVARHLAALRERRTTDQGSASSTIFDALGVAYVGPVDGHDIGAIEEALSRAAALNRSVLVHCVTRKGKGYPPAEADEADCLHSVGVVDRTTGRAHYRGQATWTTVFADEMLAVGAERDDVVCLTAAMLRPTGLLPFSKAYPDRVFDVGLAEQHLVTSAAGLAMGGFHPVVAVYATFLNRAFDQVLMDVALHRLPVTFVLDRAGVTGPDGPSHHGMWDLSLFPIVPGLRLAAPRDTTSLRELLREAVAISDGPTVLRFPKASVGASVPALSRSGNTDVLYHCGQRDVLLVAVGPLAVPCLDAAADLRRRGIGTTVVDPRWIAPLDESLIALATAFRLVVTVEDNIAVGGFGARLAHAIAGEWGDTRVCGLALATDFLPHDSRMALLQEHGLDAPSIVGTVLNRLGAPNSHRLLRQRSQQPLSDHSARR